MMTKKNWFSRSVLLASVVAVALSSAPAWAAPPAPRFMPGVSDMGALDSSLGDFLKIKVNINTNNGTFHAWGNGAVTNLSGRGQTYVNIPCVIPGVFVTSDRYHVFRNGGCRLQADGNLFS